MADSTLPIGSAIDLTPPSESYGTWLEQVHSWVVTVDHKKIGLMYIAYAVIFLLVGGFEAILLRIQLAVPHNNFLSPEVFNRIFTMHGTTMVFLMGMPLIIGFANYLVPLMIGARDMAFPRMNAFSFWMTALGGLMLYYSFIGGVGLQGAGSAPDVTWWAYAPLTERAFSRGHSTDYWALSLIVSGFGTIGAAVNIIATTVCMRCKGMTMFRMPLLAWLYLVVSGMILVTISPLTAAQIMLCIDRYLGGHFFDSQAGGAPVVWAHFFWIFGHPEVYVLVLPAFAIANEVIPVFSRKAIFGYPAMVAASAGIGLISLSVWAHHMFTVGMTSAQNAFFVLSTGLVGVPTGIKIFNWIATMWGGKIRFATAYAFLHCLPGSVPVRGPDRNHALHRPLELATAQLLFRHRPFPLCSGGSHRLLLLRRVLLLVPENDRQDARRAAGQVAFLAVCDRLPPVFRPHAHPRAAGHAEEYLHL